LRYITVVNARTFVLLAAVAACHSKAPEPPSSNFGYYLLAMTWSPATKDQCTLPPAFTLHGLWPNYTEAQAVGRPHAWPQFCGAFAHCEATEDASCAPGVPVPPELAALAPAYVNGTLATHEWSKHGSCTTLTPSDFFAAELAAIHSIQHDATPDAVRAAAGHDMARDELQRAFGVSADAVVLGCTATCELTQVAFCIAKDDRERPTIATPCTSSVTTSDYDNGCAVRHCERVRIPASCGHSI
jgi:ribonuclease T2